MIGQLDARTKEDKQLQNWPQKKGQFQNVVLLCNNKRKAKIGSTAMGGYDMVCNVRKEGIELLASSKL